ncbi:MAG: hypothetical protein WAV09_01125 [Minisyncoccia bacterium]
MKTLYTNNHDITREKRRTFLTEDVISTGGTFRVQSILGFESVSTSSGQIVCIGEIGAERTELLRTANTTGYAPSQAYKEVTLRDVMAFDHPQDTPVYIVDFNRVDSQWSATTTGTKSTLTDYPRYIDPGQGETIFVDASQTSGFYFQRFNETVGNTSSDWSDPIPYSGYDDNMVFSIKKRAMDEIGEEIDGKVITHEFLNQCLWEARREYHQSPGKRPFRRKFNEIIGSALTGSFRIELPTTVERPHTAENVYGVRIGANQNMRYYDKKQWDFDYVGKPHSSLTTAYTVGARDLYVVSARDFAESGAVSIEGVSVTYSAKSNTGGTLRISVDGTANASAGSDVWQNISYGLPDMFTVFADPAGSAYVYFNRPIDSTYDGQNIYLDSYRTLLGFDSDSDQLDENRYDMFVYFLKAKIKARKAKGDFDLLNDPDYKVWLAMKKETLDSEMLGTDITFIPQINSWLPE